jgi:iron(III) transport system substrate-binding protein
MPDIVLQAEKYKYPFGYVFPKNGTLVVTDGIALIKGSRQPELAKAFYEFVTTKESLLIQAEKYYRIPARVDMPQEKLPNWLKSVSYKTLNTNWPMIAENEANWMKQWDATIKSNP